MIGAGIFGVPAEAARLTGIFSPLVFLLCGLLLAPVVLSVGEVASYFRHTGGPILYARTAFGHLAGFQTGWAFWVARVTAFAANLNLLISSLAYLWPQADRGLTRVVLLLLICLAFTWVNVVGAKHAVRSVGILTVLKLIPLAALVLLGASYVEPSAFPFSETALPASGRVGSAALLLMYAFVGWESALVPAGEATDPARDMPRALLRALAAATLLYVLVQAVAVAVLPSLGTSERPLVDVAAALLGPAGAVLLLAGVVASVGGNVAASMLSTPRLTYALARDGGLPAWFGAVHPRFRTPANSVAFLGVIVFALAVVGEFAWLAGMSAVVRLLIYLVCIGALPHMRRHRANAPGRLRLPGGYVLPLAGFAVCVWLLTQVTLRGALVTAAFLAVGGLLYGWRSRHPNVGGM
ncbi:MAG: APC family permease [Gemmatimonadota bacterium]|nr:MAG: APC family permease [Gemmatimonadota bacterium]